MGGGGSNEVPETEEERELARVAGDKWNDYVGRYIPFENEFIQRIEVTNQDRDNLRGIATAGVNSAFGKARQNVVNQELQAGAKPGSGRFDGALERVLKKQGRSLGYANTDVNNDMNEQQVRGLESAISIGRGKEADAFRGFGELAADAHSQAVSDAESASTRSLGNARAVGTLLGGATRLYNSDTKPEDSPANG
ncbi:hypothetical protein [Aliikangiella coralliicola]|uniref:Uncharacterized protein n=1 Tax=Aliikangiella coralliicola TaxID=2592383 RepID=A0A545U077_9GAMM|nr:hypothetical protein [Aliikangiella coralliicola]TQV82866.1 hypothetical protein FLL46_24155 [Aliikangiella coralliicola]